MSILDLDDALYASCQLPLFYAVRDFFGSDAAAKKMVRKYTTAHDLKSESPIRVFESVIGAAAFGIASNRIPEGEHADPFGQETRPPCIKPALVDSLHDVVNDLSPSSKQVFALWFLQLYDVSLICRLTRLDPSSVRYKIKDLYRRIQKACQIYTGSISKDDIDRIVFFSFCDDKPLFEIVCEEVHENGRHHKRGQHIVEAIGAVLFVIVLVWLFIWPALSSPDARPLAAEKAVTVTDPETESQPDESTEDEIGILPAETELYDRYKDRMDTDWKDRYLGFMSNNDISCRYALIETASDVPALYVVYPKLNYRLYIYTGPDSEPVNVGGPIAISVDKDHHFMITVPDETDDRILDVSWYGDAGNGKIEKLGTGKMIQSGSGPEDWTYYLDFKDRDKAYEYDQWQSEVSGIWDEGSKKTIGLDETVWLPEDMAKILAGQQPDQAREGGIPVEGNAEAG